MKKIKHLKGSKKTMEANQTNLQSYYQGVTQSLLNKYKPSKRFTVVDGKKLKDNEPKAA